MSRPRHTPGIATSPACNVATSPCALPGASGATSNPALWGTLLQRLYDGAATPIEQTSAITGSPMTVVNDLANTGDRRELRQGRVGRLDGTADYYEAASNITGDAAVSTISVCVEFDIASAPSTTPDTLLAEWTTATANRRWLIQLEPTTGYLQVLLSSDGTNIDKEYEVQTSLCDGARHTAGFTLAGGVLTVFVDGAEATAVKTTDNACASLHANAVAHFGSAIDLDGTPANILSGDLHSAVLTSDVMTEAEFLAFHTSHTTPDNYIALYWFEAESGAVEFDASGNGNTLTVNGTTADIHQADTGVTFSAANSLGHTVADGSTMYAEVGLSTLLTAGTIIPRDESNPTKCCAYDSGGQVDLQYTGPAPRYGRIIQSGALQGDGVADHVVLTAGDFTALDSAANLSLTVWESGGGDFAEAFGATTGGSSRIALYRESGVVYAVVENSTTSYGAYTDATSGPNVWTMTYNGGGAANADRLKLYRNGVEVTLSFTGTIPATTASSVSSGVAYLGRANVYSANIEWCHAIHSDTLTPAEVLAIYESGTFPTDNLEALYPCSNITASGIVPDVSGNGRHGVIDGTIADVRAGRQDAIAWNQLHGFDAGVHVAANSGRADPDVAFNELDSITLTFIPESTSGLEVILSGQTATTWELYHVNGTIHWKAGGGDFNFGTMTAGKRHVVTVTFVEGEFATATLDGAETVSGWTVPTRSTNKLRIGDRASLSSGWAGVIESCSASLLGVELHNWTLDLSDETVLTDSVVGTNAPLSGTYATAILPGLNGIGIDGSTATTYAPGATADKFTPDASQVDRTGGVSHPDANVNSWDASFESGDTQTNPEFVRNAAAGDDRFLAYQDTLTGDDLTSAQGYTT